MTIWTGKPGTGTPPPSGSAADRDTFTESQLGQVTVAVTMAEEVVSNAFKMSTTQWLHRRYDVRTLVDLGPVEIVDGPFAQVMRYKAQRPNTSLGSEAFDYYQICLQDHTILDAVARGQGLRLTPLVMYIVAHELIHVIRFSKFLQNYQATPDETFDEERRVHGETHRILFDVQLGGMHNILEFFKEWRDPDPSPPGG